MTITPERLAELVAENAKLKEEKRALQEQKDRLWEDYARVDAAMKRLVASCEDRNTVDELRQANVIAPLEAENARLRDALEEIQELETYLETGQAEYGLHCGVEDRCLQRSPYLAANYGFNRCAERAAEIATAALQEPPRD